MIVPAVPAWVVLLFALLWLAVVVFAISSAIRFVRSLFMAAHPNRDGGWTEPLVIGTLFAVTGAIWFVSTADARAIRSQVADVTSRSALSGELLSTSINDSASCQIATVRGPGWEGDEARMLDAVRHDADRFAADEWAVIRYVASDMRRGQVQFDYAAWSVRAVRDDVDVRIGVERRLGSSTLRFTYTIFIGECPWVDPPDPTFHREVEAYPPTPQRAPADPPQFETVRTVVAAAGIRAGIRPEQVPAHGIGIADDCFVSSFQTDRSSDDDRLDRLRDHMRSDGWSVEGRNPVIAVRGDETVVASFNIDSGLRVRAYPVDCVDPGLGSR